MISFPLQLHAVFYYMDMNPDVCTKICPAELSQEHLGLRRLFFPVFPVELGFDAQKAAIAVARSIAPGIIMIDPSQ